jgi:hypothetical protein
VNLGEAVYIVLDEGGADGVLGILTEELKDQVRVQVGGHEANYPKANVFSDRSYAALVLSCLFSARMDLLSEGRTPSELAPFALVEYLQAHGLGKQTAARCVMLYDRERRQSEDLPLHQWMQAVRDWYYTPRTAEPPHIREAA